LISFPEIGYLGRLGNQMFQFASTVGIAKKIGKKAKFPIENFSINNGDLGNLGCNLLEIFNIPEYFFLKKNSLIIDYLYRELDFGYNEETLALPENCGISGYFQTDKYFYDIREYILDIFSFKNEYTEKAREYIGKIKKIDPDITVVSIHIRRGDYLYQQDLHPICSDEYYEKSTSLMEEKFKNLVFLVFSDDIEWCNEKFKIPNYLVVDLKSPYSELCLMTMCDHHIIANSSFSWWGAWLNKKENKEVIAPINWFGPSLNKNTKDIYCKGWLKI
jgi:hypothetical protein